MTQKRFDMILGLFVIFILAAYSFALAQSNEVVDKTQGLTQTASALEDEQMEGDTAVYLPLIMTDSEETTEPTTTYPIVNTG